MSVESVVLKDVAPRTIAYLRCKGQWRQLPQVLARLDEHMTRRGIKATGSASGVYYNTPKEVALQQLAWEVFYPIELETPESAKDESGFVIRRPPGARVDTLVHRGLYRHAGSTYEHPLEWIREQKLIVCGPAEEIYLSRITGSQEEQEIDIRLPICAP